MDRGHRSRKANASAPYIRSRPPATASPETYAPEHLRAHLKRYSTTSSERLGMPTVECIPQRKGPRATPALRRPRAPYERRATHPAREQPARVLLGHGPCSTCSGARRPRLQPSARSGAHPLGRPSRPGSPPHQTCPCSSTPMSDNASSAPSPPDAVEYSQMQHLASGLLTPIPVTLGSTVAAPGRGHDREGRRWGSDAGHGTRRRGRRGWGMGRCCGGAADRAAGRGGGGGHRLTRTRSSGAGDCRRAWSSPSWSRWGCGGRADAAGVGLRRRWVARGGRPARRWVAPPVYGGDRPRPPAGGGPPPAGPLPCRRRPHRHAGHAGSVPGRACG